MSGPRLVPLATVSPQPWRNGGGQTRELLAWPERVAPSEAAADSWRLRISIAEVTAPGAFSAFPGVQRWFAVLQGAGVDLCVAGVDHRLRCQSPALHFAGDQPTTCVLVDGPTRDLNLMLRDLPGALQPVLPGQAWRPQAAMAGLWATVAGVCHLDAPAGPQAVMVPAQSLLWFENAPRSLRFLPERTETNPPGWWWAAGLPPNPGPTQP